MPPPQTASPSSRFVLVFTAATIPEGLAARGLLESQGIVVETKGEVDGPYRFGPVYLYVPEEFEPQSRLLLEEFTTSGFEEEGSNQWPEEAESGQVEDQA
jgi:hypothetical protein